MNQSSGCRPPYPEELGLPAGYPYPPLMIEPASRGDEFPPLDIRKTVVYVSGPLSTGDTLSNIRRASLIGELLSNRGFFPIVPHYNALGELMSDKHGLRWLEGDYEHIRYCDVLYRFEGESYGGDREVFWARRLGKPVYLSLDVLFAAETPTRPVAKMVP